MITIGIYLMIVLYGPSVSFLLREHALYSGPRIDFIRQDYHKEALLISLISVVYSSVINVNVHILNHYHMYIARYTSLCISCVRISPDGISNNGHTTIFIIKMVIVVARSNMYLYEAIPILKFKLYTLSNPHMRNVLVEIITTLRNTMNYKTGNNACYDNGNGRR